MLYEKLGGDQGVNKIVEDFHKRILADGTLKGFFANTDMAKQRAHQVAFFSNLLDGPKQYSGRPMETTHKGMNLQASHFDAIAKHLTDAMATCGVSGDDAKAVIGRVATIKDTILSK